jgi:soluble lytic murein transglycosylase-like protein
MIKLLVLGALGLISVLLPIRLDCPTYNVKLQDYLFEAHSVSNIDWRLVKAVAIVESELNHRARGGKGRWHGLMQLSEFHARQNGIQISDLYDPIANIHIGSRYLSDMIQKYGLRGGIQAYSMGETRYSQGGRNQRYCNKVLKIYKEVK